AHFAGTATNGVRTFQFLSDLDLKPQSVGTQAVNAAIIAETPITVGTSRLDVAMTPDTWWKHADFDRIATLGTGATAVIPVNDIAVNGVIQSMGSNFPPTFTWTGS